MLKNFWPGYSQSIQHNFGVKLNPNDINELSRVLDIVLNPRDWHTHVDKIKTLNIKLAIRPTFIKSHTLQSFWVWGSED